MDGGMTKDEVIKLALEAGFANVRGGLTDNGELSDYWDCWPKQLERFAHLVAAAEREACAKLADKYAEGPERNYSELIAEAIRARGNT